MELLSLKHASVIDMFYWQLNYPQFRGPDRQHGSHIGFCSHVPSHYYSEFHFHLGVK